MFEGLCWKTATADTRNTGVSQGGKRKSGFLDFELHLFFFSFFLSIFLSFTSCSRWVGKGGRFGRSGRAAKGECHYSSLVRLTLFLVFGLVAACAFLFSFFFSGSTVPPNWRNDLMGSLGGAALREITHDRPRTQALVGSPKAFITRKAGGGRGRGEKKGRVRFAQSQSQPAVPVCGNEGNFFLHSWTCVRAVRIKYFRFPS